MASLKSGWASSHAATTGATGTEATLLFDDPFTFRCQATKAATSSHGGAPPTSKRQA
jgi:hypothetical protein